MLIWHRGRVTQRKRTWKRGRKGRPSFLQRQIKRLRIRKDLSQRQLAKRIGKDQSQIARWETGESPPAADDLPQIAAELDASSIDELFVEPGAAA